MFRLTKKGEYAIRALLHLASHHGVCRTEDIAEAQAIPKPFLKKIMQNLRDAGYISSAKGQKGGVLLCISPELLTLKDVLEKVEGPLFGSEWGTCLTPMQEIWRTCQERVMEILASYKFSDLVKMYRELVEAGKLKQGEGLAAFPLPSVIGLVPVGGMA